MRALLLLLLGGAAVVEAQPQQTPPGGGGVSSQCFPSGRCYSAPLSPPLALDWQGAQVWCASQGGGGGLVSITDQSVQSEVG